MILDLEERGLSYETLMEETNDLEIYEYYLGEELKLGRHIISPLRDEKNPSFSFYMFDSGGIVWRDWGDPDQVKSANSIEFVKQLYSCGHRDALIRINRDLGLGLGDEEPTSERFTPFSNFKEIKEKEMARPRKVIEIEKQPFTLTDLRFWSNYYIPIDTLVKYNVRSVKKVWLEGEVVKMSHQERPIFAYMLEDNSYKIYDPYAFDKKYKWMSNCTQDIIFGIHQLPKRGNSLILTKSLKDIMVLHQMRYNAISMQGETVAVPEYLIKNLSSRFDNIYLLYDNDITGRTMSKKISKQYNLTQLFIPEYSKTKDISDFVKIHSRRTGVSMFKKLIKHG